MMLPRTLSVAAALCLLPAFGGLMAQDAEKRFRWPDGKRVALSLSFDDARGSQVDIGVPLLDRYGIKATFYVNPRNAGKRLDAWKRAAANGHEIGNHTGSHPCTANFPFSRENALEDYTVAMMEKELDGASADIERLLGVKPATFAYPCGQKFIGRGLEVKSYVPLVARRFLVGRGFRDEAANDPAVCDLAQVLGVESDGLGFEQMKKLLLEAAAEGRWLVFAGHEIGRPAFQTTQAAALEQLLKYAGDPANGVWIDTVQAVGKYTRARRGGR